MNANYLIHVVTVVRCGIMINDSNIKKDYGVLVIRNYFMGIISLQDIEKLLEIQLGFSIKGTYHTVYLCTYHPCAHLYAYDSSIIFFFSVR